MDGILWEISHLKQELDAINEELGLCIRKNKDIDSKTLRISEATKKYMEKEESTKNSVILKDNQFKDLNILSGKRHAYILQGTGSIHDIEEVINEITSKVSKEREEFISVCGLFQKYVENPGTSQERQSLLLEKEDLYGRISALKHSLEASETAKAFSLQEKMDYSNKLKSESRGLHIRLQEAISENDKNLQEIEGPKKTLQEAQVTSEQISGDIEENEEVRKQLKDLVVGLRIQLSHLIDQR